MVKGTGKGEREGLRRMREGLRGWGKSRDGEHQYFMHYSEEVIPQD